MGFSIVRKDNGDDMTDRVMDWLAYRWERIGEFFKCKPVLVIFMFVAAIFIAVITTLAISTSITASNNTDNINKITNSFCNIKPLGREPTQQNSEVCHDLLDQLLKNPTHAQRVRIRQLATERNP